MHLFVFEKERFSVENIRLRTQQIERITLCENAVLSECSRGRLRSEAEDSVRTCFQRDRDRIIHCNTFRRLKHKTQVFLSPEGDHYRTRLTHTLEVAQIARTVARALRLNEDLTEAIALGHDLGHTPFGHAGERALDRCFPGGFAHYEQSVRVAEKLEKNGKGLNLTYEVLDGIRCHTKGEQADTLEGRIVRLADRVAYINHDIDDAIRAGVLREEDIPDEITSALGHKRSARINTLVLSIIENSYDDIHLDTHTERYFDMLHEFMFERVYKNPIAKSQEGKAENLVTSLYTYYVMHNDEIPKDYHGVMMNEGVERAACDYIAGMTDRYAVEKFSELFVPFAWK